VSNNFFQFKQFKIEQEHCAMKVCTDACLFGAWIVERLKSHAYTKQINVLDIGTGTGLLSLMIAQEIDCSIDAVEIDPAAARQASSNFLEANFASPITIFESDVKDVETSQVYDGIFSNPPFFENDLKSPDAKRNKALHSETLNLTELIQVIDKHLSLDGITAILLPYHRKEEMIKLAVDRTLFLYANADIKQSSTHTFFRTFLAFSRKKQTPLSEEIIIQDNRVYSDRFIALLQNYYLAF
jgi:tRNA1Val (adenine37-N6)-methyltransferase